MTATEVEAPVVAPDNSDLWQNRAATERLKFPNENNNCTANNKSNNSRHRHRTKREPKMGKCSPPTNYNQHHPKPKPSILSLILALLIFTLTPQRQQQQQVSEDTADFLAAFGTSGFHHPALIGAYAFNIDTQSAVVQQGPTNSYFGYSVALHKDRGTSWLLVGAPKAQTDQRDTREAGAVYRCSATSSKTCQQIAFDPNGSSTIKLLNEVKQSDDKSYQRFGASLHSANDNGSIVACAPSYVYHSTKLNRRDPVGTCWVSRGSFTGFLEYSPCRINDQWGHHHLGSCQAGFSSAITKDGSRILIGAPGSHVWQGQVFAHNLKTDLQNKTSGVNPHSEDDSYLGYSLTLGRFSSASSADDAAIGIPRGNDLAGKVMIVDREMRTLRNITGEQMGAYFGYSLATADVNGDGLDDLIIGAPLYYNQTISHKEPHFERGRVYVALQNMHHEFSIVGRLDGRKNRARFGTSLANCGDLNRDGLQDVAVGAPYDGPNGHGAVYIFMGRKSGGLHTEPDQVIYAEQIQGESLRSFGFSLSGGVDLDGNQYPDLLVGDYQADRAVLFRTRPVVNVTTSLAFQPEHFNLDEKTCLLPESGTSVSCITVHYCVKYSGLNVDNKLNFVYDIKLDTENKGSPRLFFLNQEGKSEERNTNTLTKDLSLCKSFRAYIARQIRDKLTPLKVDIDYNLAETEGDSYDSNSGLKKLKPVLNKSVANKMNREASIQKNCGPDNLCVPDLQLTMSSRTNQYTIGSSDRIILDVSVKNQGEEAYESMFYLTMPMAINFNQVVNKSGDYPICSGAKPDQTGMNVLTCDLGNPMVRNEVLKFSVITEPAAGKQITEPDFTFHAEVNSTNVEDERRRADNQETVSMVIRVDFNLVLSGNSNPPQVWHNYTHSSEISEQNSRRYLVETDLGPEISHKYQLQNRGPSMIDDIALTILWPTKTKDGKDYLLYLVDEPQTIGNIRCKQAEAGAINPYNLKYQTGNVQLAAQPRQAGGRYRRQSINTDDDDASAPLIVQAPVTTTTTTSVDSDVLNQVIQSTCGPTQCNRFECNVFDLGHNDTAVVTIRSRLYEETLDRISLKDGVITSKIIAQIKSVAHNKNPRSIAPYYINVETRVDTIGGPSGVQDLPPWVFLLAIILGITLFILLACFLKYLGFFARKRPPKGAEREPLTPTMWNDYQYSPGDTAL